MPIPQSTKNGDFRIGALRQRKINGRVSHVSHLFEDYKTLHIANDTDNSKPRIFVLRVAQSDVLADRIAVEIFTG